MKTILSLLMLLAVTLTYAQEKNQPKFEKKGNQTEATFYHDNGKIEQHGFFNKANKLQGIWTSYDAEGNKTAVGLYDNGVKVGKWFFWSENSLKEIDYDNNAIASVSEWKDKSTIAIRD